MDSFVNHPVNRFLYSPSFGLLLLRLALGLLFFTHGLMKVQALSMVQAEFIHFGFFPWVAYFISWLEVIGGLALILGIATRYFAFLFGIEMLVATLLVGFARGLGFEFVLFLSSFALMFLGSGRYSVFKLEKTFHGEIFADAQGNVVEVVTES
jgi:putative oxidoreductase